MIVPVSINYVISRIEGLHKIPTVCNKPCRRTSEIKGKKTVMDIFISEHKNKGK